MAETHTYPDSYTNGYDALKRMVDGVKSERVASALVESGLWHEGRLSSAAARVRANLNPESDQFFKFAEIVFLIWHFGQADPLMYLCDVCGYERPQRTQVLRNAEEARRRLEAAEAEAEAARRSYHALIQRGEVETLTPARFLGGTDE